MGHRPVVRHASIGFLAAIALGIGVVNLAVTQPAIAQERQARTLTVTGQSISSIPTSLALVRLGVEVQGKTAREVQEEVARRSSAVVSLLRSRNVEELQTTGISLNPVYNYDNNRQSLIGYVGANTVSFKIATEDAGTLMDDAIAVGATRIDGISFVATDEAIDQARQQAIRLATEDAQLQANTVLDALGLSAREITGISVSAATPSPQPVSFDRAQFAEAATPVVGGEQQVYALVTLEIRY